MNTLNYLTELCKKTNTIEENLFEKYDIKQGLRNQNNTGVLIGLTKIGNVKGYDTIDGKKIQKEGELFYRGLEICDILKEISGKGKYFERTAFLLLFGKLPDENELTDFLNLIYNEQKNYINFIQDKNKPSNIMNFLQRTVGKLYTYDSSAEIIDHENLIKQSIKIISYFPDMVLQGYLGNDFDTVKSEKLKKEKLGTATYFLKMLSNKEYTDEEIEVFDILMLLQAEHGGGNNSAFTVRVMSSAFTDTYSAISAGIGSLKGLKHGGANTMVGEMIDDIMINCDWNNIDQLKKYLIKIINKEAFDKKGLIYGMGHAVYTVSDPRAKIIKDHAYVLAKHRNITQHFNLYNNIENLTKEIFISKSTSANICANVDLYSGFVYNELGISESLFTPAFAMSRIPSWSAHRIEQIFTDKKIIRPAYKTV